MRSERQVPCFLAGADQAFRLGDREGRIAPDVIAIASFFQEGHCMLAQIPR